MRVRLFPGLRPDLVDRCAQVKPDVGRDLIVTRTRGMQPLAGVADDLGQSGLDIEVHVLQVELPFEGPGLDFGPDLRHSAADFGRMCARLTGRI